MGQLSDHQKHALLSGCVGSTSNAAPQASTPGALDTSSSAAESSEEQQKPPFIELNSTFTELDGVVIDRSSQRSAHQTDHHASRQTDHHKGPGRGHGALSDNVGTTYPQEQLEDAGYYGEDEPRRPDPLSANVGEM